MSDERTERPITFLVSVAGSRGASEVLEAIAPVLERIGAWRTVAHPESSLAHHAARVVEHGGSPIHLAIGAAHECYLTPALPNLLLPLWDYPEVPAIDLNRNSRMNWARVASRADLIVAPSEFLVEAFRRSGVTTPAVVAPIPVRAGWGDLATWGHGLPVTAHVPHVTWGGSPGRDAERAERLARRQAPVAVDDDAPIGIASPPEPRPPFRVRAKRATKRRLRRLKPYFSNAAIEKLDGYKNRVLPLVRRPNPIRIAGGVARFGYRHLVRRWIGEGAHDRLRGLAGRLRGRRPAPAPHHHHAPATLGASPLTVSGLAYSAAIDYDDPATDDIALLSAFLHAFADRPDVTLIVRLATTPAREAHDLGRLSNAFHAPRLEPRCRVVVVPGRIGMAEELALGRAASYHIESARTKGPAIPLMQALASGRPAIVPDHSAYRDWVDESVGLLVATHPEPAAWPMDGLGRHATTWHRIVWNDLRDRLVESASIADHDPIGYERMSADARERLAERTAIEVVAEALREALDRLPSRPLGSFTWA